jgi:putative endonuclease
MKSPCVYILASKPNGVLYIGVTSESMDEAILREKRLKEWKRTWKVRLIESMNPEWRNLFDPLTGEIATAPADIAREKR